MPGDYAIVYYMTEWRADIARQLSISLTSLDLLGISNDEIKRYLVTGPSQDPGLLSFAKDRQLELVFRERLTAAHPLPNKALVTTSRLHDVTMYCDLDIVFLKDPRPVFRLSEAEQCLAARVDLLEPLFPWEGLPKPLAYLMRECLGRLVWWLLRRYYSATPESRRIPYFNTGVFFVPGKVFVEIGPVWWSICSSLLQARRRRIPHPFFFTFYFYEQLALSLAVRRIGMPFRELGPEYNFMPAGEIGNALQKCEDGFPALCHVVTGVRSWFDLAQPPATGRYQDLCQRVRAVVEADQAKSAVERETAS